MRGVSAWAKESGIGLDAVKTLLRHQDIATTSQTYGEWEMQAKRTAQQQVIEYVNKRAAAEGWLGGVGFEDMQRPDSGTLVQ
jgi:hypothetical protein